MRGQIVKIISNQYTVFHDGIETLCIARGKLRLDQKPKVGDFVEFESFDDTYGIERVYPRKNELVRPPVANIDQALVMMSAHEPDFSSALVDRLSFFCQMAHITPIICITKMDLAVENDPIYPIIDDYRKSGYQVVLSDKTKLNDEIIHLMKDKVTTLIGQSGVGKSSLMNLIDPSLNLSTQVISKALNRGKHTTRHSQLYRYFDGFIADTPGFSALDLNLLDVDQLKGSILDFNPYIQDCFFNDCHHINEPKCAVKQAVNDGKISKIRYDNYLKVIDLIKENKK